MLLFHTLSPWWIDTSETTSPNPSIFYFKLFTLDICSQLRVKYAIEACISSSLYTCTEIIQESREMAEWVKCSLCSYENQGSHAKNPCKSQMQ